MRAIFDNLNKINLANYRLYILVQMKQSPLGEKGGNIMRKDKLVLLIFVSVILNVKILFAQWWTSTENFGWAIECLTISGNNVLAGSTSGLFLSTDNGTKWIRITSGLPNDYAPNVLAVNNETVFMVVSIPNSSFVNIYRSTDDGFNWSKIDFKFNNGITSFAFIGSNIFAGCYNGGIYVSPDNGASWAFRNEGFPKDSSGSYLMIPYAMAVQGSIIFAGIGDYWESCGLFLSADSGKSWNATGLMNVHIDNLVVCTNETGDTNIIATTSKPLQPGDDGYPGARGDVFLSKDHATTWTKIDSGMTEKWPTAFAAITNGSGGTNLFVGTGGDGVYLTTDWGKSWISDGLPYNYIWSLAAGFGEDGTPRLFAGNLGPGYTHGTGSSVFFTSDNGVHWYGSAINTYINALALSPNGSGGSNMFAVASNVFMSSTNNGETWAVTGLPRPNFSALAVSPINDRLNGTNIFFGAGQDGVFHSADNGANWIPADSLGGEFSVVTFLSMTPNLEGDTVLFAGTNIGGFTSTNNGASWIPKPGLSGKYITITSQILSNQNEFVGTKEQGVFISNKNDTIWQAINTGLTNLNINTFTICNTILFAGTESGIFRYAGSDTSWDAAGLEGKEVNAFAVKDSSIFAGTSGQGVFLSNDYGMTWKSVNTGLANLIINGFVINDGDLIAGTAKGIWRRSLSEMITYVEENVTKIPLQFILSQNYPNPFNPVTTIKYSIPKSSFVTIKIFNLLGQEVRTLVNEKQKTGEYSIEFNASNLASGVYFYSIQAGTYSLTKKMILLK